MYFSPSYKAQNLEVHTYILHAGLQVVLLFSDKKSIGNGSITN